MIPYYRKMEVGALGLVQVMNGERLPFPSRPPRWQWV